MSDQHPPFLDPEPDPAGPEVEFFKDFSTSFRGYSTSEVDRFVAAAENRISTLEAEAQYLGRALEATDERVRDAEAGRQEAAETVRTLRTELEELNASLPNIDVLRGRMDELRGQYDERIRAAEIVLAWVASAAGNVEVDLPETVDVEVESDGDDMSEGSVEIPEPLPESVSTELGDESTDDDEPARDDIGREPGPGWTEPPPETEAGIPPPPETRGAWSPPEETDDPKVG